MYKFITRKDKPIQHFFGPALKYISTDGDTQQPAVIGTGTQFYGQAG